MKLGVPSNRYPRGVIISRDSEFASTTNLTNGSGIRTSDWFADRRLIHSSTSGRAKDHLFTRIRRSYPNGLPFECLMEFMEFYHRKKCEKFPSRPLADRTPSPIPRGFWRSCFFFSRSCWIQALFNPLRCLIKSRNFSVSDVFLIWTLYLPLCWTVETLPDPGGSWLGASSCVVFWQLPSIRDNHSASHSLVNTHIAYGRPLSTSF